MANTLPIVHKRTSISGRLPEVTNTQSSSYIRPGELSINLTDKKVHSSNGSALFEVGSNLTNLSVQTITANGTVGVQDQILRSDGTKAYWDYFVGYAGSRGATGFTGSQGPIGFTGSQGVIGFTGSQGILGGVAQANIDMNGLTISNASVINAVSVNISGNLTVSGTATTVNTVNLDVTDAIVRLNRGQATPANDIGIMMQRFAVANSTDYNVGFAWDEGSDRLIFGTTPEDGSDNDLSFSTEWMTIAANGNVGIGTSTPTSALELQAGTAAGASVHQLKIKNTDAGAASVGIQGSSWNTLGLWAPGQTSFSSPGLGVGAGAILISKPISEYSTSIRFTPRGDIGAVTPGVLITSGGTGVRTFAVRAAASQTASLTEWQDSSNNVLAAVAANGNVGIGSATPDSKLVVRASAGNAVAVRVQNSDGTTLLSMGSDSGAVANVEAYGTLRLKSATALATAGPVYINAGNVDVVSVISTGQVGIGNSAPLSKLTIQDTLTANNTYTLEVNPTWNATANTFTAIRANVTDTASNTASRLASLRVGGTRMFEIGKRGQILFKSRFNEAGISGGAFFDHRTGDTGGGIMAGFGGGGGSWFFSGADQSNFTAIGSSTGGFSGSAVGFGVGVVEYTDAGLYGGVNFQTAIDTVLGRDAAGALAQRVGTSAQTFRVYGTFTDASNHERVSLSANGSGAYLLAEEAGTGVARDLFIGANNTTHVTVAANGNMGIGTTVPVDRLHIRSAGRSWRHDSTTHGNLYAEFINSGGVQYFTIRTDNSSPSLRLETVNKDIHLLPGSSNVGIGTTSPTNKLFVTGDIGLDGISVRDTATTTTTAVTQITLFEYPIATYDSCDVIIKAVSGGERHTTKLLVTANSTVAIGTEYGTLLTGSSLYSVDCDISGANTRIRITPATTTSTVFKASYELITA